MYIRAVLVQAAPITGLTAEQYDAFLESGWFRGSSMIYRSEFVCLDKHVHSIINIRQALESFSFRKSQRRLIRKVEARFRVDIQPAVINARKEELYVKNLHRFRAFIHGSLEEIIFGHLIPLRLNTMECAVYDNEKLVALSYFDVGERSSAGILGVFDPEYSKHSLGYYTLLKEVEWAKLQGLRWYYPGYIMDGSKDFDYKLRIGAMEYMRTPKLWEPYHEGVREESKAHFLKVQLAALAKHLRDRGIAFTEKVYPYFTTGHLIQTPENLLRIPCYLEIKENENLYAATFDMEGSKFVMYTIEPTGSFNHFLNLNISEDYKDTSRYEMRLMRVLGSLPIPLDDRF